MSNMVNICLVLHPLNTIKDVIEHTGLVRNIYAEHGKQTYYIIPVHLEPLLKKHLKALFFQRGKLFKEALTIY